ncbi:MAG: aldo/keto reductase, partial [Microcystaceae cyanobacterium]
MRYRRFGKTNLNLSVFSLGTMRCLSSPAQLEATVHQALALGINHLETARGYGKSEVYLGQVLKKIPRTSFYITTKICPTDYAEAIERAIDESLSRLQLDYVDNLAIHGINTPEHFEQVTRSSNCLTAIAKAQQEGKIKHIGFSTHGSLDLILNLLKTDLFDFINLHYYYFWQRNAPAIALAAEKDLGIFIISPGDKGGQLYTPPERLKSLCHPLTPLALTYRFLLSDPRITTLSLGPTHPNELM